MSHSGDEGVTISRSSPVKQEMKPSRAESGVARDVVAPSERTIAVRTERLSIVDMVSGTAGGGLHCTTDEGK